MKAVLRIITRVECIVLNHIQIILSGSSTPPEDPYPYHVRQLFIAKPTNDWLTKIA